MHNKNTEFLHNIAEKEKYGCTNFEIFVGNFCKFLKVISRRFIHIGIILRETSFFRIIEEYFSGSDWLNFSFKYYLNLINLPVTTVKIQISIRTTL